MIKLDAQNQYSLFVDSKSGLGSLPKEAGVRLITAKTPTVVAASANGHRSIQDMWRMSRALSDRALDVLLFPTVYSYVPVISRAKKLVVIHDVIAETYPSLTLPSAASRLFWKTKVALGRFQADAIVTVSDYSRQSILNRWRIARDRVFVVGEASDPVFRLLDHPEPSPHLKSLGVDQNVRTILYVGGFSPHKNLEMLVNVFAKFAARKTYSDVRLVMVGDYKKDVFHSYFETIRAQVDRHGISDRVIFSGYLPDEELVVLLNLSTALVLPSLIEGFGLPAIEAASCGCPVIATSSSPLPALLGGGGIYIDPTSPEELETALFRVLDSEAVRHKMRREGVAAASQLNWDSAARQMISLMHKVVQQ